MSRQRSRYTVVVDNLSTTTRTADIEAEFKYAGRIRDVIRDAKARCALVEFDRSADADYAYRKMHGMTLHGRQLKVEYATPSDFKFFGWKWTEGYPSPSPAKKYDRSRSRSPADSRESSRSPSRSRSRSRTPPETPHNYDDQRGTATASRAQSGQ